MTASRIHRSSSTGGQANARLRSVRFPVSPLADEGLAGLIARTCAENVLGRVGPLLEAAGFASSSLATAPATAGADHLAAVLGVELPEVERRLYRPMVYPGAPPMMDFFGVAIRTTHRCGKRRRIAPAALRSSPHHRALWELTCVTFCNETWELLTEHCVNCGTTLGWRRAQGIAICDTCGADQRSSACPTVAEPDRGSLGFIIGLIDPRPEVRTHARTSIPAPLAAVDGGTLFELALALGEVQAAGSGAAARGHQAPHEYLARGAELVLGWPAAFEALLEAERNGQAHEARSSAVLRRFRRLMWDRSSVRAVAELLHTTYRHHLIDTRAYTVRTRDVRHAARLLTARDVARLLRIDTAAVTRLREAGLLTPLPVGGRVRMHGWFKASDVAPLRDALANRMSPERLMQLHGLRLPAVEQLVRWGLIGTNDHPAVRLLYPGLQLDAASVRAMADGLASRLVPATEVHADWVPLPKLLRGIGGREKPVGLVIDRALAGRIALAATGPRSPFHFAQLLAPRSLLDTLLEERPIEPSPGGLLEGTLVLREPTLADQEAMEQLNCNPREYYGWARGRLAGRRDTTKRGVDRARVESFARLYVSSVELAERLGQVSRRVTRAMRRLRLREFAGGSFWRRDQVEARLDEIEALLACRQLEMALSSTSARAS